MRGKSVASNESLSSPGLRLNSNSPSRAYTKARVGFFEGKTLTSGRSARDKSKGGSRNLRKQSSSVTVVQSQSSLNLPVGKTMKNWHGRSPSISVIKEQLKGNRQSMVVSSRNAFHKQQSQSLYHTIKEDRQAPVERNEAAESQRDYGLPPAKELETVWQVFNDDSARRRQVHPLVLSIKAEPIFANMTVLVLENKGIERIFDYLKGCRRLIALYLKGNRLITRDLVQIQHLQSLRRADLSANYIHFLPDSANLAKLTKLEYLSLHDNQIVGWRQLENMASLKQLHYLTLMENPCSKILGYRRYLIESMPHLRCLDNFIVMDFEREEIAKLYPAESLTRERLQEFHRFRPFNKATNYWETKPYEIPQRPLPRVILNSPSQATQIGDRDGTPASEVDPDLNVWHRDYYMTALRDRITEHLYQDSYDLRRKFEYSSPVVTIQKTGRMYIKRRLYLRKRALTRLLVWSLNRWYFRGHLEHMMSRMKLTREMLFQIGKVRLIQKHYRGYRKKVNLQQKFALRAQSIYRMRRAQVETLAIPFGLELLNEKQTTKKILFLKSQLPLLARLGISQLFDSQRQSEEFALRRNLEINRVEHARSPLMNTIISIYRYVRVLRAQSFFAQVVHEMKKTKKRRVLKLTQDGRGNSKVSFIEPQQEEKDSVAQKMSEKMQLLGGLARSKTFRPQVHSARLTAQRGNRQSIDEVLNKPLIDDDTALVEMSFETDEDVYDCLRLVQFYNWQQDTSILFFYEPFLRKFEAALRLQRFFKGWIFRRRQKPLFVQRKDGSFVLGARRADKEITGENTVYAHFILIQRVTRVIQKAYRGWRLRHRTECLTAIAQYVRGITSSELYLDQNLYQNIHQIFEDATGSSWKGPGERIASDAGSVSAQMRENSSYWEQTQSLYERRFRFEINVKDCKVRIQFSKKVDKMGRYLESNFPLWFQRLADAEVPKILKEPKIFDRNRRKQNIRFTNSIKSLLHAHPFTEIEKFPTVARVADVVGPGSDQQHANRRVIKLTFQSVAEAKNRAIVLALLTCNVRKNELCFIRMFTAKELARDPILVTDYLTCMQQSVFLPRRDKDEQLASAAVMKTQPHHGVVKKREDPYATLLRARPKQAKNQFTRFIVLGDASAASVKERLGDAFISNEVIDRLRSQSSAAHSVVRTKHDNDYNFTKQQSGGRHVKLIRNFDASVLSDDQPSYRIPTQKKSSRNNLPKASNTFAHGGSEWQIDSSQVQRKSQLSASKRHVHLRNSNLTPQQAAIQKRKLSHDKNQLLLLERLNTKLEQLKEKVEEHTATEPAFKSIFLDQLIQIWKTHSRRPSVAVSQSARGSTGSAYFVDIPKRDYNYLDPRVDAMDPERLQEQIRELHKEYSKHKDAYRKAITVARLTNRPGVRFLDEDSAQASDMTPMTPRSPAAGDRRRSRSSNSRLSPAHAGAKVTFQDQYPQFRDPEVRDTYMREAVALVGPSADQTQPTNQIQSTSALPGLPAEARPMPAMPTDVRIRTIETNVDLPSFDQDNMVQQLFRVGDSRSSLGRARAQNEQRLIQQSQSMHDLRNQKMVIKAHKFMRQSKEKDLVSFTQNFVNQTNRLSSYEARQLHSDIKSKSKSKLRQASIETRQKSKMRLKRKANSNLKLDSKAHSPTSKRGGAETLENTVRNSFLVGSPGNSKLKHESSYIRPESNQQRIRVQAKQYIPDLGGQSARVPLKTSLIESDHVSRSQILDTLKPSVAEVSSQQSISMQTQLQPRPSLPVISKIHIPEVQKTASNFEAATERIKEMSRESKVYTQGVSEHSGETRSSLMVRQKTDAVLLDLSKMQRAREIQAFQEQQSNQTNRLRLIKKKISPSRTLNQTSCLMEPRKQVHKNKLQSMMMEQQLAVRKNAKRPAAEGSSAMNQLPGSTMPKNSSMNTIETIMRNRQHKIDEKQTLLKDHGLFQNEEQMSQYMADDFDASHETSAVEDASAESPNPNKRAMSPFNYQVNDLVLPRSTMVGVSRSKYINQFIKNDRRRMLSFLPSLQKQCSLAKLQQLQ